MRQYGRRGTGKTGNGVLMEMRVGRQDRKSEKEDKRDEMRLEGMERVEWQGREWLRWQGRKKVRQQGRKEVGQQ